MPCAERHRGVHVAVADRQVGDARTGPPRPPARPAPRGRCAARSAGRRYWQSTNCPSAMPAMPREHTRVAEMGPRSVDAVGRLAHLLEEEDGPVVGLRQPPGAEERAKTVRSPPMSGPSTTPGTSDLPSSGSGTRPSRSANSRSDTHGGWSASCVTTGACGIQILGRWPGARSGARRCPRSPPAAPSGSRPKSMAGGAARPPEPPRAHTTARLPGIGERVDQRPRSGHRRFRRGTSAARTGSATARGARSARPDGSSRGRSARAFQRRGRGDHRNAVSRSQTRRAHHWVEA